QRIRTLPDRTAARKLQHHRHALVLDQRGDQPECHLAGLRPVRPRLEQRGAIVLIGGPSDLVMHSLRIVLPLALLAAAPAAAQSLEGKARLLQKNLTERHMLDGLYVSIVPAIEPGVKLLHTVDEPGNVIHAGVWTGRYLAGVGYQYAV